MKKISLLVLVSLALFGEDFISDFEYGQMLYRDSRGVSCVPCHGEVGEGKLIVSYYKDANKTDENHTISIYGPDIRHATLAQISSSLKEGKGVMPKYFLTDKEIEMIYAYLKEVNSEHNESKPDV
jgi:mono/diheme cytochrome c family protein